MYLVNRRTTNESTGFIHWKNVCGCECECIFRVNRNINGIAFIFRRNICAPTSYDLINHLFQEQLTDVKIYRIIFNNNFFNKFAVIEKFKKRLHQVLIFIWLWIEMKWYNPYMCPRHLIKLEKWLHFIQSTS